MIAKKSIPLSFTPNEKTIARGRSAASVTRHYYVLSTKKPNTSKCIVFYYSQKDQEPETNSGPVDIPIYDDCCINLQLGDDTAWEFAYDDVRDALTLGDKRYAYLYSKLNHISKTELEFQVRHATPPRISADRLHGFSLYINLYQSSETKPWKIPVKIDPDILNPGIHPDITGAAARRAKPKNRSKRS